MGGDELTESFKPIVEKLLFDGVLDESVEIRNNRLASDPEWSSLGCYHLQTLIEAFVYGVISADSWHHNYKLPPDFESVVNWMAFNIQKEWPKVEVIKINLIDLEKKFRVWAFEHPSFKKWNESVDGTIVGVCSAFSNTPDHRDFIDLDALLRNAMIFIKESNRNDKAFDFKFNLKINKNDYKEKCPVCGVEHCGTSTKDWH
jgi:hypothetical protein